MRCPLPSKRCLSRKISQKPGRISLVCLSRMSHPLPDSVCIRCADNKPNAIPLCGSGGYAPRLLGLIAAEPKTGSTAILCHTVSKVKKQHTNEVFTPCRSNIRKSYAGFILYRRTIFRACRWTCHTRTDRAEASESKHIIQGVGKGVNAFSASFPNMLELFVFLCIFCRICAAQKAPPPDWRAEPFQKRVLISYCSHRTRSSS